MLLNEKGIRSEWKKRMKWVAKYHRAACDTVLHAILTDPRRALKKLDIICDPNDDETNAEKFGREEKASYCRSNKNPYQRNHVVLWQFGFSDRVFSLADPTNWPQKTYWEEFINII